MSEKRFFIETYGCQMNVNDSEVVASILRDAGYSLCEGIDAADLILVNTCSVRDNAEQRVWGRLNAFRALRRKHPALRVGVLGCMAERLKNKLLEHEGVDLVCGPDAYRNLPAMLNALSENPKQIDVELSHKETYSDISPLRMDRNGVSAFISIMRGCNNMCSYCIVPYVRGAERSRDPFSIEREALDLVRRGYKEINLLGQNVDSYSWTCPDKPSETVNFAQLLERVASTDPSLRVRFATSHPKDISDEVLRTMAKYPNICRHIHLPVQSGSNAMLLKMHRKYTRESYLERVAKIREIIPDCAISSDFITGFCSETEEDHRATLSLMREVAYDSAFMFRYSERPNTRAARQFPDDVPLQVKIRRLNEIIALQRDLSLRSNRACIGKVFAVLVEGPSKRSDRDFCGRTTTNKMCVFPRGKVRIGELVPIRVLSCTGASLLGEIAE